MSVIYTDSVEIIKQEIDNILQQNLKISAEYVDIYNLYGCDNKLLVSVEKNKKDSSGAFYRINLSNCGFNETIPLKPNWQIGNYYYAVKPFFTEQYQGFMPIDDFKYTSQDASAFYAQFRYSKDYAQNRFIMNLIHSLYKARCPVDRMQKIIFYFDNPKSKREFANQFDTLNHDNKLQEYKTSRENVWFFSGKNYSRNFSPMNEESQQIFDKVKIALHNQKQNVK